jgi:polar amino acid transport system substrate-binding protein
MTGWIFRLTVAAVLAVVIGGAPASCGDDSYARLKQSDSIRIGYAVEAPYAFLSGTGEVTGVDPEVARRIVARLGIGEVHWVLTEFGSLIAGLQVGRFDVIAAGMFITKERSELVSFSEPTFHVQQGLLVPGDNPLGLHSYEAAVSNQAVRVAALSGAVEETLLLQMGLPQARLVGVPDALAGVKAVESGVADALALSSPTFHWMALKGELGATTIATPFEQPPGAQEQLLGFGGFAFRQEDEELREAWNAALRDFMGSPEHLSLLAEFGMTQGELPGDVTTGQIIGAK